MDDDDGNVNERMNIDNDYEGGQWINGEFFYSKKKEKRKQTKEEQLYGVFADSDSDGGGGRRKRGKDTSKGKEDYTVPVAFVRSATVINEPPKPAEEPSARSGLGAGPTAGLGLGFRSAGVQQGAAGDDDEMELPSAFGQRLKEAADARKKQEEAERAKQRKLQKRPVADREVANVGSFEQHTKGALRLSPYCCDHRIGTKLLEKMGYKAGMGLGRDQSGIARALETKMRPAKMGMGFNDFQEQPKAQRAAEEEKEKEKGAAGEAGKPGGTVKAWKRKAKEVRLKRVYKTAEEILAEKEASHSGGGPLTTIIDMRGAQARVITNMDRLNDAPPEAAEDDTPLPELQYNLRLIVDRTEADIQRLDQKLRHEKDTAVILGREQARLRSEAETHALRVEKATELLDAVTKVNDAVSSGALGLSELLVAERALKARFPEEWAVYGLGSVALAKALPMVAAVFVGWSPLAHPGHGAAELAPWRAVLESPSTSESIFADVADDPYLRLLSETALPPLRSAIANTWDPRAPEVLLGLLEAWDAALPPIAKAQLLDHSVMPKLVAAVDAWDPRTEVVAIHLWLHPWLAVLGPRLEPLYGPIRLKLGHALAAWHPSDGSALALLSPWQRVFAPADWEGLLVRCIGPKLGFALQELVVNPAAQVLDPLRWVLAWAEAMPTRHLAALLESVFFPKWHAVLHQWLSARPDYDEVTRWFLGWKGLFPEELLAHEKVRRGFNLALDLMNQALAGQMGPMADAGVPPPPPPQAPPPEAPPPPPEDDGGSLTLRELLERFAEEQDILFMPKAGRQERGLQVSVSMSQLVERNQKKL